MPTYEYRCGACGHEFEMFQSITASPIKKCPQCGKNKVNRLISSGAGLIFKGSGFYITDYRDSGYKDKAKADAGSNGDAKPSTDSAKGDAASKPAVDAKPSADAKAKAETKPAVPKKK